MRLPDHLALAALLVEKAADDEAAIAALLAVEPPLDEIVGFHAQQACEKLLKAVLASHGVTYRYTHVIAGLLDDVADKVEPVPEQLQAAADLTPLLSYTATKLYPMRTSRWTVQPRSRSSGISGNGPSGSSPRPVTPLRT